ncbi:MAG TPA: hypothetical protein VJ698_07715 [Noviherbaspirillum sp.]|uniref:hypothetical protein n=1 Tax=Noviherbaspirillum sp. TaxID=1926288 RepID=UPI002B4631EC|nr:hypothetical protein [Noviherbaspirillum sp.]HJV85350.1 hypothetical protein [Noviherbaspirillum sp.]
MTIQTTSDIDLTIQSFAYVARKLAEPSAPHERILDEAEKHRSALRLLQRDMIEQAEQGVRRQALTKEEFRKLHETVMQAVAQAEEAISSIVAQYTPQRLAA